jgi:hypothetical protein
MAEKKREELRYILLKTLIEKKPVPKPNLPLIIQGEEGWKNEETMEIKSTLEKEVNSFLECKLVEENKHILYPTKSGDRLWAEVMTFKQKRIPNDFFEAFCYAASDANKKAKEKVETKKIKNKKTVDFKIKTETNIWNLPDEVEVVAKKETIDTNKRFLNSRIQLNKNDELQYQKNMYFVEQIHKFDNVKWVYHNNNPHFDGKFTIDHKNLQIVPDYILKSGKKTYLIIMGTPSEGLKGILSMYDLNLKRAGNTKLIVGYVDFVNGEPIFYRPAIKQKRSLVRILGLKSWTKVFLNVVFAILLLTLIIIQI